MPEKDDKEKAEKLAAAKKRVEQLKKQKARKSEAVKKDDKTDDTKSSEKAAEVKEDDPTSEIGTENKAQSTEQDGSEIEHEAVDNSTTRSSHTRQPSISIQSRMRSTSFRRTSASQGPISSSGLKSPSLPPLSSDDATEVYRRQAARIEDLERENKRVQKESQDGEARWRKSNEELEELREANSDIAGLRAKAKRAEDAEREVNKLKADMAALQRQNAQLQSTSKAKHSSSPSQAYPDTPADIAEAFASKSSTIESMEMEISSLRAQLEKNASSSGTQSEQVSALQQKLTKSEQSVETLRQELNHLKKNLDRTSERAVREGSERTSAETKMRILERETADAKKAAEELQKKCDALERKTNALTTLHRESDSRSQARSRERDRLEKEAGELRAKMAGTENENLRLREERDRLRKRVAAGADDDGVDELEDEERKHLEAKVRQLEEEAFDLRRGVWREKRIELQGGSVGGSPGSREFDDVDLGPSPRRGSLAKGHQQSFSNVLSSGFNALTGGGGEDLLEDDDEGFDEDAFRMAQEDEARHRVERVREVKRGLNNWKGWRVDLVEMRRGGGGGIGVGEIFEV